MEPMDSTEMSKLFGNFYDHQSFTLDDSSRPDSAVEASENSTNAGTRKKRLVKKCPDAPKRFKSAYICFVTERMDDVKKTLSADIKVTEVMKVLASMWKTLPPLERIRYEKIADADKARYFEEMNVYEGPMQVPNKRQKKPAGAPKRGMSAFLSFSQQMRPQVRAMFPDLKNTDISTVLAQRWHAATEDEKRPHLERELRDREKYHVDMAKWKLEEKEQQSFDSNQQQSQASTVSQSQSTVQNAQQKLYQGDIIIKNVVQSSMSALKRPCTDASGTNNSYNTSSNPSQISQTFTNQQGSGTFTENEMKTKMTLDFLDLNSWDEAHAQYGVTGNGDVLHALMNQQQNQHHQAQQQPVQGNNATNNNKQNQSHQQPGQGLPSLDQMNQFLHGHQHAMQEDGTDDEGSDHNDSNFDSNDSDTNRFWDEALNHLSHNSNSPDTPGSPHTAAAISSNSNYRDTNEETASNARNETRSFHALPPHLQGLYQQQSQAQSQSPGQNQGQSSSYYPANITAAAFAANHQQHQHVQQNHYALGPLYEKPVSSTGNSQSEQNEQGNQQQVNVPLPRGTVRTHEQQQQHQQLLWQQMTAIAAKANANAATKNQKSSPSSGGASGLSIESSKALTAASGAVKSRKSMLAAAASTPSLTAAAAAAPKLTAPNKTANSAGSKIKASASSNSLLPIELAALSSVSSNGNRKGFYMSNISKLQQILDQSGFSALYDRYHTGNSPVTSAASYAAASAAVPAFVTAAEHSYHEEQTEAEREAEDDMMIEEMMMQHGQPSYVEEEDQAETLEKN